MPSDCFDGMAVSWFIGPHLNANLVHTMLHAAIDAVQGSEIRPVIHSDRGAHYRMPGWLSRMHDVKLVQCAAKGVHQTTLRAKASLDG